MKRTLIHSTLFLLGLTLFATTALAERKNPLEGQPAVRHRYELRDGRFEIGPSVAFSINRALRHAILAGAKLEYHINDWLSFGADVGYGIGIDTGLTSKLKDQCNPNCLDYNGTAVQFDEIKDRFSNIQFAGDARVAFTPVAGKMGIFSKLFIAYDLYIFGGVGFAMLANKFDGDADADKVSQGFRIGPAFGVGMHMYFSKFFNMGVEIRDLVFSDNESGGDVTRGLTPDELSQGRILIDADDTEFSNHWFVGINFTFFLPTTVDMSR